MNGWMDGGIYRWRDGWMEGWINGWRERWGIYGGMDGGMRRWGWHLLSGDQTEFMSIDSAHFSLEVE